MLAVFHDCQLRAFADGSSKLIRIVDLSRKEKAAFNF